MIMRPIHIDDTAILTRDILVALNRIHNHFFFTIVK